MKVEYPEDINLIRERYPNIFTNFIPDLAIENMWTMYSDEVYSVSWTMVSEETLKRFKQWMNTPKND